MIIIGADYHPTFQQIAFVDTETGELQERRRRFHVRRKRIVAQQLGRGVLRTGGPTQAKRRLEWAPRPAAAFLMKSRLVFVDIE
jgi:hypothetical protein